MSGYAKPKVYISYTWLDGMPSGGKRIRVPDARAFALAERLRETGFDSRLDLYFKREDFGFSRPQRRPGDRRDPWMIWAEEQISDADCVLLLCTPEYIASDPQSGACPGAWCYWHLLEDSAKFNEDGWPVMFHEPRPALWWDWHCIAVEVGDKPEKFIPVGFGPYDSRNVPAFVRGAAYYDLDSESDFNALRRVIRSEHRRSFPRKGAFVSYAHTDGQIWLDSLQDRLSSLTQRGVEIWTDKQIKPGEKWHDEIQNSLARAKVAVLLVTKAFLRSSYIASHELPNMLQAARSEGLVIFPIPINIKSSDYDESVLAPFQAAHPLSQALSKSRPAERDKAFSSIVLKLQDALGGETTTEP